MSRLWTGLLWLPTPTVDGRTIKSGALRFDGPVPLRMLHGADGPGHFGIVGSITDVWMIHGFGIGVGQVDDCVAAGVYPIGIDVGDAETEITEWSDRQPGSLPDVIEMTLNRGNLRGATLLGNGDPAWPGAEIRVHEAEA